MNRLLLSGSCKNLRLLSVDVLLRLLPSYMIKHLFIEIAQSKSLQQYLMNNTRNTVYDKIINNKNITKSTINKTLEKNTDFSSKVKYMSFFYKQPSC